MDVTDADFVDIIHANGKKLIGDTTSIGMLKPIGSVDFYPNGGEIQPGIYLRIVGARCFLVFKLTTITKYHHQFTGILG